MELKVIARIRTDFPEKFGIPRQAGLAKGATGRIVFLPEYRNRDALRGIEGYSHLWLIWEFSESVRDGFSPTVRPPRLGGNKRVGVFATRSPFRPNPIGLSSVRLLGLEESNEGTVLIVEGADLLDGTPIYDIKPYLAYTDSHPDAIGGFADEVKNYKLRVNADEKLLSRFPGEKREMLLSLLEGDPRPSYQKDESREYGMKIAGYEIKFIVKGDLLTLTDVTKE